MGRRKLLVGKYQISDRPAQQESPGIEVKLGWDLSSSESVTVKAFDLAKFDNQVGVRELIRFEMNTLWRLDHPNVVRLVDVFTSPTRNKTFVVVEAVSGGGDLFETIAAKGRLEDDFARHYFDQLLDAVEHCHARGVCHRDIKPENVLLDARGNVKLTGFALAGLFDPSLGDDHVENLLHATCGTPDYTAPEVIQGFAYEGAAADVWSLGVTLYAMLAGYLPFEAESLPAVFDKAQAGDFKAAPGMSVEARSLLECMLEPDPESRYTMQDVRAHKWLVGRTQKYQWEQQLRTNHHPDHHHRQQQEEETNLRWNGCSPSRAGNPGGGLGGRPAPAAREGAFAGTCRDGNDGDRGGGIQGWSLDSFVRRQQQQQQEGTELELGPTDGQRGQDCCEQQQQQQHNKSSDNREGSCAAAESTISGGRSVSSSSTTTPSSFQREGDSPFHDCSSPSECEEEEEEQQEEKGVGVGGQVGLSYAEAFAVSGSAPAASAAGGSYSNAGSSSVAAAAAADPSFSRSICGSQATSGAISVARRLRATRLVLSLRLLDNDAATTAAETDGDGETDTADDGSDRLLPAKALQRALESLGCACRLLLPTKKKHSDENKNKTPRVKVKACRAIAAGDGRDGGERGAEQGEVDSIVGVVFSAMLPAEVPAPPDVASAVGGGGSMDGCRGSSGGATKNCTNSSNSSSSSSSSSSGTRRNRRPETTTTEFLAVLSTGTVADFNALVDDLLAAVPTSLPSTACLGSEWSSSKHAAERRARRQTRPRRGRALAIGGGGMGGQKSSLPLLPPLAIDSEMR